MCKCVSEVILGLRTLPCACLMAGYLIIAACLWVQCRTFTQELWCVRYKKDVWRLIFQKPLKRNSKCKNESRVGLCHAVYRLLKFRTVSAERLLLCGRCWGTRLRAISVSACSLFVITDFYIKLTALNGAQGVWHVSTSITNHSLNRNRILPGERGTLRRKVRVSGRGK